MQTATLARPQREIRKPYADVTPQFQREIVRDRQGAIKYNLITPLNYSAIDWALGNLHNAVRWGKSFVVDQARGARLRDFMDKKEGFKVEDIQRKPRK